MGKQAIGQTPDEFYRKLKKRKQQPKATIIAGILLVLFTIVVFFLLPKHLPGLVQKLTGLVHAALAGVVVFFAISEYGKKFQTFSFWFLKKIDTGKVAGGALFALVLAWWLSPYAPIRVGMPAAADIESLLGNELTLAVLVMPDPALAVIEIPLPPVKAAEIAKQVPNDADSYSLLLKAIAERRYPAASALATRAAREGTDATKLAVARGMVEIYAGHYDQAPQHFVKAIETSTDASTTGQASVAFALAGDITKSYELASKLVEGARSGESSGPNALPMALNIKASIAVVSGRFKEAVELSQEAQLIWEDVSDSAHASQAHKAASRNNQAVVYAMLPTKYAGAETQFDGATQLWRDLYGPASAHVAGSQNNLGVLAMAQAHYVEAEERLNKAIELAHNEQNWPQRSAGWSSATNALARLNAVLGRYETAQKFVDEADKAAANSVPLLELANLAARGAIAAGYGSYTEAAGKSRAALETGKQMLVPDHIFLGEVMVELGEVNLLREHPTEVDALCREAITIFDGQLGENHPLTAAAYNTLGYYYGQTGKRADARKQFEKALAILEANSKEVGPLPEAARSQAGLASLLTSKQQMRKAIGEYQKAISLEAKIFGKVLDGHDDSPSVDNPTTANYLFGQAQALLTNGATKSDFEQAASIFEHTIEIRERFLLPSSPKLAAAYDGCAAALKKLDRNDEAAEMEKKASQARALPAGS